MNLIRLLVGVLVLSAPAGAGQAEPSGFHEMQHGFVLAVNDNFASHLVASGHHSRQTEITGRLIIESPEDRARYQERKRLNAGSYFLLQAQNLDLPSLKAGRVLTGHIVESPEGGYDPENIVVRKATFHVDEVLLNIKNPFFGG